MVFLLLAGSKGHLHVHPMFLHSNATSHKWAFGGIELMCVRLCVFVCLCFVCCLLNVQGKQFPNCFFTSTVLSIILFLIKKPHYFFILLFTAVAELLDNAVDEVIFSPARFILIKIYEMRFYTVGIILFLLVNHRFDFSSPPSNPTFL